MPPNAAIRPFDESEPRRIVNVVRTSSASLAATGLLFAVLVATGSPPVSAAPARVGGIDVSQWQGAIDWTTVASTPTRFAILRATKGRTYEDPSYTSNLAGATAAGMVVGAYHRATPSGAKNDAAIEADHFLTVARNAAGDVLPALDIEETGGLDPVHLRDWVKTWVGRVRGRMGVRPMLYASPYFWELNMGDTTWFADHGYPLWIAHWQAAEPRVPAGDWGSNGWTFWQWTATGHVSGITTDVDRDRFNGDDLARGQIASLTVTPSAGGVVTGGRISCGGSNVKCTRLANPGEPLTLTATPDAGAVFLGWHGACKGSGSSPVCTVTALGTKHASPMFGYPLDVEPHGTGAGTVSSSPAGIGCGATCTAVFPVGSTVTLMATPDSASGFGTWSGGCAGSRLTCDVTVSGPTSVGARFDAAVFLQENGPGTRYAWGSRTSSRAIGGSYRWDHRAGASLTFRFRGTAVSLFTANGPAMGTAEVSIDGTPVATLDGYASAFTAAVEHRYGGLSAGHHTISITATGASAAGAKGTRVAVDALRWGGILRKNPLVRAGSWGSVANASAGGGAYVVNDVAGATASLKFTGTGVTWRTARGPRMGRAEIWIDGALRKTVDLYAAEPRFHVGRTVGELSDGSHVATIVVLGTHAPASTGTSVVVDGWVVR
jgi:GH25 family lysozyme M1 (1,4-beta-N-acetylmuramidase)